MNMRSTIEILKEKDAYVGEALLNSAPLLCVRCGENIYFFTKTSHPREQRIFYIHEACVAFAFEGIYGDIKEVYLELSVVVSDFIDTVSEKDITGHYLALKLREIMRSKFENVRRGVHRVGVIVADSVTNEIFAVTPSGDFEHNGRLVTVGGRLPDHERTVQRILRCPNVKQINKYVRTVCKRIPGIPDTLTIRSNVSEDE